MERRHFLGTLSAPVIVACAACLGACSKSGTSSNNVTAPTNVNFTVDLSASITTIGASIIQSGVIVVRLAAGNTVPSFSAVQVACTHEGTNVNFNNTTRQFNCPNHGAVFTSAGAVVTGPATRPLQPFNMAISGNILTVTS